MRVAFLSDTRYSILTEEQLRYPYDYPDQSLSAPGRALKLIKAEGAELVLHGGDIGYDEGSPAIPEIWDLSVTQILGADFPVFASAGNHDRNQWESAPALLPDFVGLGYNDVLLNRYLAAEANPDVGPHLDCTFDSALPVDSIGRRSTCTYKNLTFVTVDAGQWTPSTALGQADNQTEAYLLSSLQAATTPWLICNWHFNQRRFQTGFKSNEAGWKPYEYCRSNGAIIATGHEHSYSRTHLMSRFAEDSTPGDIVSTGPNLTIDEGQTVAWVSGLGGHSIRTVSDQAANPWWAAKVNATNQSNAQRSGAVFCDFRLDSNANAVCYFKMVDGVVYDRFELVSNSNDATGTFAEPYVETNSPPFAPVVETQAVLTRLPVDLTIIAQDADGPNPLEFWSTTIPAGLTLNRQTGAITGIPTQVGQQTMTVFVWDGVHTVDVNIDWQVQPAPIMFDTTLTNDCLANNGRIVLTMTNTGPLTETVSATVTGLAPRTLTVAPGAVGRFSWSGRPDRIYDVEATAAYDGATLVSEQVAVSCDPQLVSSCLSNNGRIDVNVLNTADVARSYVVIFGNLTPRIKLLDPGAGHRFTVTGRPDGPIEVVASVDSVLLFAATVEVDCDPDSTTSRISCLAGNGRVDVFLVNDGPGSELFVVTFGTLPPRQRTLGPGVVMRETTTGRPDGPLNVRVTRSGVTVLQQIVFINCD